MNSKEIKQKRTDLNLTQDDLALLIGKSRKTINSYEQGANIPKSVQNLLLMHFQKELHKSKTKAIDDLKDTVTELALINARLYSKIEALEERMNDIHKYSEETNKIIKGNR